MRIGIDAREAARADTGTGTYVLNLVKALLDRESEEDFVLFVDERSPPDFGTSRGIEVRTLAASRLDKVQDQWAMAQAIHGARLDVFHATHHDVTPLLARVPIVATVLDLAWLDVPGSASRTFQLYYRELSRFALRKASRVVTISESTRVRVANHFPGVAPRMQAIPIACDPRYRMASDGGTFGALAKEFGVRRPYFLYAGSFAGRKNLAVLLQAMQKVFAEEPDAQLVLAGRPSGRDDTSLHGWGGARLVVIDRKKQQEEMQALYGNAEALVFPSRYEGFGLPVLEAMSCGCPVLVANATSLPEIVGDAGCLFDPDDPSALSVMLLEVLRDPDRRARMRTAGLDRARKFDWGEVAAATLLNYRLAVSRPRDRTEPVSTIPS